MPPRFARRPLAAPTRAAVAASLLIAACAQLAGIPPDTSEATRVFEDVAPGTAFERTVAALRQVGLEIQSTDPAAGTITAVGRIQGRGWAECPGLPMVAEEGAYEDGAEGVLVEVPPAFVQAEVTASVSAAPGGGAGGARVSLDPAYTAKRPTAGIDPSPEACNSTGVLERLVFRAVSTGGAPVADR